VAGLHIFSTIDAPQHMFGSLSKWLRKRLVVVEVDFFGKQAMLEVLTDSSGLTISAVLPQLPTSCEQTSGSRVGHELSNGREMNKTPGYEDCKILAPAYYPLLILNTTT
jgi:hypothetical protein